MKIAVVGCGAVGSYYGAKLCRAGQDVSFLLRSDYDQVRRDGVTILSPTGDFNARPHCARSPQEIGVADLVLIGLKTTANDRFAALVPPLVGNATAVLTLQNGLGNEEALAKLFSRLKSWAAFASSASTASNPESCGTPNTERLSSANFRDGRNRALMSCPVCSVRPV